MGRKGVSAANSGACCKGGREANTSTRTSTRTSEARGRERGTWLLLTPRVMVGPCAITSHMVAISWGVVEAGAVMTSCPGAAGGGGGGAAWAGAVAVCWEPAMAAAAAASSAASLASAARAASRASASQAAASMAATASATASASASAGTPGGLTSSSSPPSPKVPIAGPKRRGGRRKGCALRAAGGGRTPPLPLVRRAEGGEGRASGGRAAPWRGFGGGGLGRPRSGGLVGGKSGNGGGLMAGRITRGILA